MRSNTLAVVISSLLLAGAAAQAQDAAAPAPETQTPAATQSESTESSTSASQDADAATGANPEVGEPASNVDEQATSGAYYPYSAGTVGDDPAYPKETTAPPVTSDGQAAKADQWSAADTDGDGDISQDELNAVAPTLSAHFDDMDVDKNEKLTRDEFRTWQESNKARMDADQPATSEPSTSGTPDSASQDDVSQDPSTTSAAPETDTGQ